MKTVMGCTVREWLLIGMACAAIAWAADTRRRADRLDRLLDGAVGAMRRMDADLARAHREAERFRKMAEDLCKADPNCEPIYSGGPGRRPEPAAGSFQ